MKDYNIDYLVIEDFQEWNDWYSRGEVEIADVISNASLHENQGVILKNEDTETMGIVRGDKIVSLERYYPCKISPLNTDQELALHILNDERIPLKVLSGVAGSGKTLLACAHALEQVRKDKVKIVIAKSMTPVGRDIGFLKGDLYEKVRPWLGPFYDNFINCGVASYEIDDMVEQGTIEIVPITFIQGRSLSNTVVIIDEVQNLDMNIVKQIITRASANSEIILLGDQTQVFSTHGDKSIETLLKKGRMSPLVGAVHMSKSLRSPIANWAVENL